MKITKSEVLLFIFFILIVVMAIVLFFISFTTNKNPAGSIQAPSSQSFNNQSGITIPLIQPDGAAESRLISYLENKNLISEKDRQARDSIVNTMLFGKTGTLYESPNVRIFYITTIGGFFEGEILTANIDLAKQEVVDWFTQRGLSHQGVCRLPIIFYFGEDAFNQLVNKNIIFSPLPPGC